MKTTTTFVALLTTALAAPTPQADTAITALSKFAGIAIRSGSNIQFASINAANLALWLNKDTASYCPETVPCPTNPPTSFIGGIDTLSLSTAVPGGQQVYIAWDGRVMYTQAHSTYTGPHVAVKDGFSIVDGELLFMDQSWTACPEEDAYAIYAGAYNKQEEGCLGFKFTVQNGTGENAWQYT